VDFESWIHAGFGDGLARHFLVPYNEKVWAHPLATMGVDWQGERVPEVDVDRILANAAADRDDAGWGPNRTFTFPSRGTGLLYERLGESLARSVRLGCDASSIDPEARTVHFTDGSATTYDQLVSTLPLDQLVQRTAGCPAAVRAAAESLVHTSALFVGLGVRGEVPPDRCWVYFPDPDVPFYRMTYLSNYSPEMTPGPGCFSLLVEISVSAHRPFDPAGAIERTIGALVAGGFLTGEQATRDLLSTTLLSVPYAYPVPTLDRDDALATIHGWLEPRGIRSRGRFGAWRYEIGNTDHALMMGVEVVDHLVGGRPEQVWVS
jgi:UDP-galactopyranose mutase